jgi:hypothetical protein
MTWETVPVETSAVGSGCGSLTAPSSGAPLARRRPRPRAPAMKSSAWALALYALLSLAFFGSSVLPPISDGHGAIIAKDQVDSSLFMWFFAWWPHALLHGLNPFVTHLIFVPEGFNLQWTTSMPGPSVALSPLTLAFSPAVTWNVIELASPALSAWTAFLLCRHVTGKTWPSLVGGYAFGFSPYMLAHLTGGPFLALVPLLPIFVLLVLRRLDASLSARRFLVGMTAALAGQFLISTEVLATAALFGGFAMLAAYVLFADHRRALAEVTGLLLVASTATAVLMSPFLFYFFAGRHYPPTGTSFSADLLSLVKPPYFLQFTQSHTSRGVFLGSGESYLGIPLLVLVVTFAWEQRRSRAAWLAIICLALAVVASLGGVLNVNGRSTAIWLPWRLLAHLPVLRYAIPIRFVVYAALPGALILAIWLARSGGVLRWGLALVTVASVLPNVGNAAWHTNISDPPFFATGAYRAYLKPTDHVLTVPALGPNERWQADTGFRFALAGGYAGAYPASYMRFPTWNTLLTGILTPDYASQLRRFVADKGVTAIVVDKHYPGPWKKLFGSLSVPSLDTGGVLLYRLPSNAARTRPPGTASAEAVSSPPQGGPSRGGT